MPLLERICNINYDYSLGGVSSFQGVCQMDFSEERFLSSTLIRDQGVFDGVLNTVHHLGHLYDILLTIFVLNQVSLWLKCLRLVRRNSSIPAQGIAGRNVTFYSGVFSTRRGRRSVFKMKQNPARFYSITGKLFVTSMWPCILSQFSY